jgi:hypothetical protein
MNYPVIWTKKAIDQLAQAWIDASDRTAGRRASNRIDSMLAMQPHAHGESRTGNDRLMYEPPLAVYYRIDDSDRKVFVISVKLI